MARRQSSLDPLFDEPRGDNGWVRYVLIFGIVAIVGFIAYAALVGRDEPQGPVPVIRADETPWTRAPSEAGGMEIPNQDSTVFDLMDKSEEEVEAIAAETETETPVGQTTDKPVEKTVDEVVSETVDTSEDKPADTKSPDVIGDIIADEKVDKPVDEAVIGSEVKSVEKPVEKPVVNPMDEAFDPKASVKPVEKPVTSSGKTVQVRLGSVPGTDKAAAAGEYNRLKAMAGGAMAGATPSYEPVTLDGKGSFVRINASMDKDAATKLCDTLSAKGAPCLILNP